MCFSSCLKVGASPPLIGQDDPVYANVTNNPPHQGDLYRHGVQYRHCDPPLEHSGCSSVLAELAVCGVRDEDRVRYRSSEDNQVLCVNVVPDSHRSSTEEENNMDIRNSGISLGVLKPKGELLIDKNPMVQGKLSFFLMMKICTFFIYTEQSGNSETSGVK